MLRAESQQKANGDVLMQESSNSFNASFKCNGLPTTRDTADVASINGNATGKMALDSGQHPSNDTTKDISNTSNQGNQSLSVACLNATSIHTVVIKDMHTKNR